MCEDGNLRHFEKLRVSKFFALTPGEHTYSMRINYVISTPSTGRFTLASGQQLSTLFKVPQNAQVEAPIVFTDLSMTNKGVA
ncbi:MAG TPA: hypothetical protein VIH30_10340, partial [Aquirhabdus sp.]